MAKKALKALISVSNKEGLTDLAKGLQVLDFEIVSTGGTAKKIQEAGVPVKEVSEITGVKEFPQGLVKTLHPKIHFAILMDRQNSEHVKRAAEEKIEPFDLVVGNLYPFQETAQKTDKVDELIANIDIGGVAMIRAAAKNHKFVTVVTDPQDYSLILKELSEKKEVSPENRKKLAVKAFEHTADYDSAINAKLAQVLENKELLRLKFTQGKKLRYGENWHQQAKMFQAESQEANIATAKILQGKEMSFNNYVDASAALEAVKEFDSEKEFGVAIIKHTNPCGFASSTESLTEAFEKAWQSDPVSAFGSVIACNREVDLETAKKTEKRFIEIIIAPAFSSEALAYLKQKKNLRLLETGEIKKSLQGKEFRFFAGGVLEQDKDNALALVSFKDLFKPAFEVEGKKVGIVSQEKPSLPQGLFEFAWKACKHVKSNAIVLARAHENGFQLLGMGAGQPNRLDSVRKLALTKAKENLELEFKALKPKTRLEDYFKQELKKCVLASDAFFPFRDSIDVVAETGVKNVIQPGGSIRDNEVIEACNKKGLAMVFTGMRHFKH